MIIRFHFEIQNKVLNFGQGVIANSNFDSGFSSCEFHSIDEFSMEQSTIIARKMNFEKQTKPAVPSKGCENKAIAEPTKLFDYKPAFRDDKRYRDRALRSKDSNRRVINVEQQIKDSKVSYVLKDISSYDK